MKLFRANVENPRTRLYIGLVLAALVFTLGRSLFLYESKAALVLAVGLQLYLPGVLLARALGKLHMPHPVLRFAWVLVCGLSLTVCLGAAARFLQVPLPVYLVVLHGIMLALALIPPPAPPPDATRWRYDPRHLPLYGLLALCCVIVLAVGVARSQFRFNGYEDQTVFISLADWLANDPDDAGLIDRRIGVPDERSDKRWLTDGWTYTHAAWVWASGVPAAELIWYDLAPLFVWATPLAVFALAYELTRRESAGVWSAAALTLAGLLTLDGLVYHPTTVAFGQFALFQVNTLRAFSTALMLPLALLVVMSYLRAPNRRDLLLILMVGLALATMHPRQIAIFQISVGALGVLWWLARPTRQRLIAAALLALVLVSLLALPFMQRLARPTVTRVTERVEAAVQADGEDEASAPANLIVFNNLPVIGTTYIFSPQTVFYHPLIVLGVIGGLAMGWWWRRALAAQYIFAATLAMLALFFVPGVTALVARLISVQLMAGMIFMLPLALILGLAADLLYRAVRLWRVMPLLAALVLVTLLVEPFPIPASARDQLHASNTIQAVRDIQPFDHLLLDELRAVLPDGQRSVLMTPDHVANYVIESIPHTLVTGGRPSSNEAHPHSARFFTQPSPRLRATYPWLDAHDMDTIARYEVTHIVIQASDTRLPQLVLQPDRFEQVGQAAGYVIFALRPGITPGAYDARFEQMNAIYSAMQTPRWQPDGFVLPRPADPDPWGDIAAAWADDAAGDDDRARYGLAFTYTMMGEDAQALPLWEMLHERYPDLALFADAVAHTRRMLESSPVAIEPLLAGLSHADSATRVLAARSLFTETFFYLLDDEGIEQVIAVAEAEPVVWWQLAQFDQQRRLREQVALLLSANHPETAARWLDNLPRVLVSPQDMVLQAAVLLAQGETDTALDLLRPATDAGWYASNAAIHPDRWVDNTAAQMYHLLRGAEVEQADRLSPLALAGSGALFALNAEIAQEGDQLTVTAVFGNPYPAAYPVQRWRVQVTDPAASRRYGQAEIPAVFDEPLLTRAALTVDLPDDIGEITPALVFIEPLHSETVRYPSLAQRVVLNPPPAAEIAPGATQAALTLDGVIQLLAYAVTLADDALRVTLYWQADSAPGEDYQVFVHVMDAEGDLVLQRDSGPVDDRYPTSLWQPGVLIEDTHLLPITEPLPPGEYQVRVGMYRLSDFSRLEMVAQLTSEVIEGNSLLVGEFTW